MSEWGKHAKSRSHPFLRVHLSPIMVIVGAATITGCFIIFILKDIDSSCNHSRFQGALWLYFFYSTPCNVDYGKESWGDNGVADATSIIHIYVVQTQCSIVIIVGDNIWQASTVMHHWHNDFSQTVGSCTFCCNHHAFVKFICSFQIMFSYSFPGLWAYNLMNHGTLWLIDPFSWGDHSARHIREWVGAANPKTGSWTRKQPPEEWWAPQCRSGEGKSECPNERWGKMHTLFKFHNSPYLSTVQPWHCIALLF